MMPGSAAAEGQSAHYVVPHLDFEAARLHERQMLEKVMARGSGARWSVWRTEKCLVVPRSLSTDVHFHEAAAFMADVGWPVRIRDTGGDVTPQCPDIINVTHVFILTQPSEQNVQQSYVRFCGPLLAYLADCGIKAYLSGVERAFCDGKYNIAVNGKKLAGTAQRWRPFTTSQGHQAIAGLAHAAILSAPSLTDSIAATNAFYTCCRQQRVIDENQHVTLASIVSGWADTSSFASSLGGYLGGLEQT